MWSPDRRSRDARGRRPRKAGAVIALLACLGLAACTPADATSATPTAEPAEVTPLPANGELAAGTYLVTGFTVLFEITVPDGWHSGEWFVWSDVHDEYGVAVNFGTPGFVPTDACAWRGHIAEVGPSAKDFAEAMAAQTSTATTPAVDMDFGGLPALEFDHWVEDGIDVSACDGDQICLHSYVAYECNRWHSLADENETYRVVELNGERAVIARLESGPAVPELVEQSRAVFDSIDFVVPEQ